MTREEIILFKELIKEVVNSSVKDVIREELKEVLKKDMREVKLLLAKSIKENSANRGYSQPMAAGDGELRKKMREAVGSDFTPAPSKAPAFRISEEQGVEISTNGTLPDFDAPIPFMSKDSSMWKDMSDRIS